MFADITEFHEPPNSDTFTKAVARLRASEALAPACLDFVSAGQSSGAIGMAQLLLGHEKVFRIEPVVTPGRFALDKYGEIDALSGLGATEARKAAPSLAPFFAAVAEPFEPFHLPPAE